MSLKNIHLFVIAVSTVLAVTFAFWCLTNRPGATGASFRDLGLLSVALSILLVVYGVRVYRKFKGAEFRD